VIPNHDEGDLAIDTYKLLDEIESLVEEGKHMFGLTMISREDFFELTNKLRASLPDEMRRANRVNQESERIVVDARETAEQTVDEAKLGAQRVIEAAAQQKELILQDAKAKKDAMLEEAKTQAYQMTYEAKLASDKRAEELARRAEHLVSESEVMRIATAQARELVASAELDAKEMRRGADEYAREELSRIERVLTDTIITVQRGRNKLEQRSASQDILPKGQSRNGASSGEMASTRR
jgi:cell division septum initiation protein DivIVA